MLILGFLFISVFFRVEAITDLSLFGNIATTILFIIIGLVLAIFVDLILLWKTYSYKVTDKGIYFDGGIFIRKQKFNPLK